MTGQVEAAPRGIFLGVGFDASPGKALLSRAEADIADVRHLLAAALEVHEVPGRSACAVRRLLNDLAAGTTAPPLAAQTPPPAAQPVVLFWAGHAEPDGGELALLCGEIGDDGDAALPLADVVRRLGKLRPSQLLVLIDVCHGGLGTSEVLARAERVLAAYPPHAERQWVGILTSAGEERARDGLFGAELVRLLREGPQDTEARRRWSRHSAALRGDDLCDALLKEWPSDGPHSRQRPQFRSQGNPDWFLPNPLYQPGALAEPVSVILDPAVPITPAPLDLAAVDRVAGWISARAPGVYVLTGSPGTGKTTILERVVRLSLPGERRALLGAGPLPHADPGEHSIAAHVQVRGRTARQLARLLDAQLTGTAPGSPGGFLPPDENGPRGAPQLAAALERRGRAGAQPLPVMVIDGLDELGVALEDVVGALVTRLAPWACVVVSTRRVPLGATDVVAALVPADVLDLDDARPVPRRDVWAVDRFIDDADEVGAAASLERRVGAGGRPGPPLGPSGSGPVEGSAQGSAAPTPAVASPVERLEQVLARLTPGARAPAERLLSALTFGFGAGFPEEEWLAALEVLTTRGPLAPPEATAPGREVVSWLLAAAGEFVLQDGEAGVATYRIADEEVAAWLTQAAAIRADSADLAAGGLAADVGLALVERYLRLLRQGVNAQSRAYLWRYAWRHAALAGPAGIGALRGCAEIAPGLAPDVPLALGAQAERAADPADRARLWAEAVAGYRPVASGSETVAARLAGALESLAAAARDLGDRDLSLRAAAEAVEHFRELAGANAVFLPDLAEALQGLGATHLARGEAVAAGARFSEAVRLLESLTGGNAAFRPDLCAARASLEAFQPPPSPTPPPGPGG